MRYAKIDWQPGASEILSAAFLATATTDPSTTPNAAGSFAKADLVQLAAALALLRDSNMIGSRNLVRVACYDKTGAFIGIRRIDPRPANPAGLPTNCAQYYPVTGDGPLVAVSGGGDLPSNWSCVLARATDNCLRRMSKGKEQSTGAGSYVPVVAPAVAAIIVGGIALSVIGAAAAWRWLDPELRKDVAQLDAAQTAFSARLQTQRETGTLPPPGPIETSVAKRIEAMADDELKGQIIKGAAVVAATVTLVATGVAIHRAMR